MVARVAAVSVGERTRCCQSVSFSRRLTASVLLLVPRVVVVVGVVGAILLVGQSEREDFVISGSSDLPVTGSPVESAVHDRWPVDYRASAREVPEDIPGGRVQRIHLSCIRACIGDPVRNAHRTPVTGTST